MDRISDVIIKKRGGRYITPLFWQHGEDEEILRDEMIKIHENGMNGVILESRPHPDFLGEKWWRDVDVILDEAKKRNMKVWFFDDSTYPSGFANGKIRDRYPDFMKVYLAKRHIDARGPRKDSSFLVRCWLEEDENLVAVVGARRVREKDELDSASFLDLTDKVTDGILYWDVPEGSWRIFLFIQTRNGGEEWTKDYLNPLVKDAVSAFIDIVYEEHYRRYPEEFGNTIAGFFTDEPRFGNASTYEATLGKFSMVLPYCDDLLSRLDKEWQGDFTSLLPALWYDAGEITGKARYTYMNVVSRLFGENYTKQIGDWCRAHRVKLIGHVVEDNGAHARLGYGSGHFFRSVEGQDYSGLDVVYQIWPEHNEGFFTTPFGYLNADFFYWGITKMATSAGHIDPKKQGTTVCEVFGAYGWQEGLKLMKWLTDHICVRGVNFFIPHAFSPKFPDPDCPPHFYARGANPQWRYFHLWSAYTNRLCHLLSGGRHVASVAVLYHGEAEWAGDYEPFEKVVKTLAKAQIDCDVLPADILTDDNIVVLDTEKFQIYQENYNAMIVPYSQNLPWKLLKMLNTMADYRIPVIFIKGYPMGSCDAGQQSELLLKQLRENKSCLVKQNSELTECLTEMDIWDVKVNTKEPDMRCYHYVQNEGDIYFFTNEGIRKAIRTQVIFRRNEVPVCYHPMDDKIYEINWRREGKTIIIDLYLEPYESMFILFLKKELDGIFPGKRLDPSCFQRQLPIDGSWEVSKAQAEEYPNFRLEPKVKGLGNIAVPDVLPNFSGTLLYRVSFLFNDDPQGLLLLDLGEVYEIASVRLNEKDIGVRISPPYYLNITGMVQKGNNVLEVEVTNTLAKKIHDVFSRAMAQEPSGLLGPVRIHF